MKKYFPILQDMDYALVVNESLEHGRDLAACSHTELNVNQIHKFKFLSFGKIDGNLLSVLVLFYQYTRAQNYYNVV